MSEYVTACARVRSAAVHVSAPADVVMELVALTRPFITVGPGDDAGRDGLPSVLVRPGPPREPGWQRLILSSDYEPDRVLWVHDGRRAVWVSSGSPKWRTQQVLRSVRHMLRWQAYQAGDLLLHGGLVSLRGRGVAFVGGKRSGKTSSILSALVHGGAGFVSNDDLALVESPGGGLTGYGSPRTVNIRTDSLLTLAESNIRLTRLLSSGDHPTNTFAGKHRTTESLATTSGDVLPGSLWVRPAELAEVTGCVLIDEHAVDALVFPAFDSSATAPALTRLGGETARAMLDEHIELQGTKYDPFLADWFPGTDLARRQRLVDRLVATVRCYRLTQSMGALAASTAALLDELAARSGVAE
ncbi:hypothetical protein HNP84_001988 [Thermocatellispora tengchongensis]|uniref:Serine kinase n=1 Tax=Thermocatellispora tengchongensis TaxID=1073253 RepID=A0A840NYM3_9ACTN|nr:hypothetical protein [Thermocatellispora tengchongensis]MBB5132272.1 hypothetical protein [Thermocatellispora tengchongensis]